MDRTTYGSLNVPRRVVVPTGPPTSLDLTLPSLTVVVVGTRLRGTQEFYGRRVIRRTTTTRGVEHA